MTISNEFFGWRVARGLVLALSLSAAHVSMAKIELIDRIVAIVEEDVVLMSELNAEVDRLEVQIRQAEATTPPAERLKQQALERLILRKLQLAAAEKSGLNVDDNTVTAAIQNIAEKNQLTVPQLQEEMLAEGMDIADFREDLRQQILISRLRKREVIDRIQGQSELFSATDFNSRTIVEIRAAKKSDGWFFHAITGEEWLLKMKFRTAKNTFRREDLVRRLDLKPLNDLPDLPLYGTEPRVRCRNLRSPWQEIELRVHSYDEIDRKEFWQFVDEAVAGFIAFGDTAGERSSGTAFERFNAFQDGFFNGAARCLDYSG